MQSVCTNRDTKEQNLIFSMLEIHRDVAIIEYVSANVIGSCIMSFDPDYVSPVIFNTVINENFLPSFYDFINKNVTLFYDTTYWRWFLEKVVWLLSQEKYNHFLNNISILGTKNLIVSLLNNSNMSCEEGLNIYTNVCRKAKVI